MRNVQVLTSNECVALRDVLFLILDQLHPELKSVMCHLLFELNENKILDKCVAVLNIYLN